MYVKHDDRAGGNSTHFVKKIDIAYVEIYAPVQDHSIHIDCGLTRCRVCLLFCNVIDNREKTNAQHKVEVPGDAFV